MFGKIKSYAHAYATKAAITALVLSAGLDVDLSALQAIVVVLFGFLGIYILFGIVKMIKNAFEQLI